MLKLTQAEIIALYESGGYLVKTIAFGDWWRYLPHHKLGQALVIESEAPRAMVAAGLLRHSWSNNVAKIKGYELVPVDTGEAEGDEDSA